jgi:hypothetical protein
MASSKETLSKPIQREGQIKIYKTQKYKAKLYPRLISYLKKLSNM